MTTQEQLMREAHALIDNIKTMRDIEQLNQLERGNKFVALRMQMTRCIDKMNELQGDFGNYGKWYLANADSTLQPGAYSDKSHG